MPSPKPCPHCGTLLVPGVARPSVFCPGCGAEVTLPVDADELPRTRKPLAPAQPMPGGPPIPFQCGRCGQPFQAASEDAGKRSRCPSCGTEIVVPTPKTPAPMEASSGGPPSQARPPNRPMIRTTWLLVLLAALAAPAVWWTWWGMLVPAVLLTAAWGLRGRE